MPNDKPSKLITKLIEERKGAATRIASLEAAAALVPARIRAALDEVRESHTTQIAALKAQHDDDWKRASEDRDGLLKTIRLLRQQLDDAQAHGHALETSLAQVRLELSVETERANNLDKTLLDVAPQISLIAEQRAALQHICDGVRERMRRKEQQDESAILNRGIVARAAPELNRGG